MTWDAAMRWALIRARETGVRRHVYAYRLGFRRPGEPRWVYAVGVAVTE